MLGVSLEPSVMVLLQAVPDTPLHILVDTRCPVDTLVVVLVQLQYLVLVYGVRIVFGNSSRMLHNK